MRNRVAQIKKIMKVYLSRGRDIEKALSANEVESADKLMRDRDAAFHNLRAVMHQAESEGLTLKDDPEILWYVGAAQELDKNLIELIKDRQVDLIEEVKTLNRSRRHLNRYQSGRVKSSGFENSA